MEEAINLVMLVYNLMLCVLTVVTVTVCSIPEGFILKKPPLMNDTKSRVFQKSDRVLNYCLF